MELNSVHTQVLVNNRAEWHELLAVETDQMFISLYKEKIEAIDNELSERRQRNG